MSTFLSRKKKKKSTPSKTLANHSHKPKLPSRKRAGTVIASGSSKNRKFSSSHELVPNPSKNTNQILVSVDIGSTTIGVVYSFTHQSDTLFDDQEFSHSRQLKAPFAVLFKKSKNSFDPIAFGSNAISQYITACEEDESGNDDDDNDSDDESSSSDNLFLFSQIRKKLLSHSFNSSKQLLLSSDTHITNSRIQPITLDVFSVIVPYFQHLSVAVLKKINLSSPSTLPVTCQQIYWSFTVPDTATPVYQFILQQACVRANLISSSKSSKLLFANRNLSSVAECFHQYHDQISNGLAPIEVDHRLILVQTGFSHTCIQDYSVSSIRPLSIQHSMSPGSFYKLGAFSLISKLEKLLENVFTPSLIHQFIKTRPTAWKVIQEDFIRSVERSSGPPSSIFVPLGPLVKFFFVANPKFLRENRGLLKNKKKSKLKTLGTLLECLETIDKHLIGLKSRKNALILQTTQIKYYLEPVISSICTHLTNFIKKQSRTNAFFFSGGLFENPYFTQFLTNYCQKYHKNVPIVLVPSAPSLSAARGSCRYLGRMLYSGLMNRNQTPLSIAVTPHEESDALSGSFSLTTLDDIPNHLTVFASQQNFFLRNMFSTFVLSPKNHTISFCVSTPNSSIPSLPMFYSAESRAICNVPLVSKSRQTPFLIYVLVSKKTLYVKVFQNNHLIQQSSVNSMSF